MQLMQEPVSTDSTSLSPLSEERSEPPAAPEAKADAVDAAREAIWRLFQQGFVDEDMATAGLLAVDLGTRRARRRSSQHEDDVQHGC